MGGALWENPPPDLAGRAAAVVARHAGKSARPRVFFRADDIHEADPGFLRLARIFSARSAPLCLAVVPAWTTPRKAAGLLAACKGSPDLWCFHQHGFDHGNRSSQGKKSEFPDTRDRESIHADLDRGKGLMAELFPGRFRAILTPPWNRVGEKALASALRLGFDAVSRSLGSLPPPPPGLPDFPVHVDLHTRKETDPRLAAANLLQELNNGLEGGLCGIMIHHALMNDAAFDFLERLVGQVAGEESLELVHLGDLARAASAGVSP